MLDVHAPHEPHSRLAGVPEKLGTRDLDDLAGRTMEAQGRLANFKMFLDFEGSGLKNLPDRHVQDEPLATAATP
jgi:hypothetical protein